MRSARPNRTVSAANRSERRVRKVDCFHRGSGSERGQRRGDADQERHLVLFIGSDDESDGCENGEA